MPWTPADLHRASHIPQSTLSRWANHESDPDVSTLLRAADATGLSLDQLVGRLPAPPGVPPVGRLRAEERRVLEAWRHNDPFRRIVAVLLRELVGED